MSIAHPFQLALYALLAGNTCYFAITGPWTKGLDSLAWFVLLMLFALETQDPAWLKRPHARGTLHSLRIAAAAGIALSTIGYVRERDWLDAINISLWMLVVALLECELRWTTLVAQRRRLFTAIAAVLYASIGALVPLWAWRGEWFDAYDAVLWLLAFALIEMDALKLARAPLAGSHGYE